MDVMHGLLLAEIARRLWPVDSAHGLLVVQTFAKSSPLTTITAHNNVHREKSLGRQQNIVIIHDFLLARL
jgi:hypothetical protein